jgi:hypothetical protein
LIGQPTNQTHNAFPCSFFDFTILVTMILLRMEQTQEYGLELPDGYGMLPSMYEKPLSLFVLLKNYVVTEYTWAIA